MRALTGVVVACAPIAIAAAQPLSLQLPESFAGVKAVLAAGGAADIVVVGDSLSFRPGTWIYDFRDRLALTYGDAGAGYQGFSIWTGASGAPGWVGGVINADVAPHRGLDGLWLEHVPAIAGSGVTFTGRSTHASLHYLAGPDAGVFTVAIADGASHVIDGAAPSEGVGTFGFTYAGPVRRVNIQQTGPGRVVILGQDNLEDGGGVRVHRVANGGWGVNNFLGRDETFDRQMALLGPELVYVWLGQNDQGKGRTEYGALIGQLVDRIRASAPTARVVLVASYDSGGAGLAALAWGMHDAAVDRGTGYINLYGVGGTPDFLLQNGYLDGVHFSAAGGAYFGKLMFDAFQAEAVSPFCGATFVEQPQGTVASIGSTIVLSGEAVATAPIGYQWFRFGQALSDGGRINGAQTPLLTIAGAEFQDTGMYMLRATTACGYTDSAGAAVTVARDCPADLNADGFVDAIDYDGFITAWLTSDLPADFNGDEFVDAIDYDEFVSAFLSGC